MTVPEAIAVLVAGFGAGTINGVIGAGTLVSFPVLLAAGYPPVVANCTNGLGLVPGSVASVVVHREDLRGHWRLAGRLALATAPAAIAGAVLLLALPERAFDAVVPVLIAAALVLVVLQPWIAKRVGAAERARRGLPAAIAGTGLYGGYFGAGQGVLLFAALGTAMPDRPQLVSALRVLLAGLANLVSALVFIAVGEIAWDAAALIAAGATVGGVAGVRIARRLSPTVLRGVVVAVGLAAIAQLVL